jgi:putative ABC transport system permease protein
MAILAVAMGASVMTALLSVSLDIREKVNRELRTYGANLLVVPQEDLSLLEWEGVDYNPGTGKNDLHGGLFLQEKDLLRLKKTFWRNHILGFVPLLETDIQLNGRRRTLVGTWFDREMELKDEKYHFGIKSLRPWWEVEGRWVTEEPGDAEMSECMIGSSLAQREGFKLGDEIEINIGDTETPELSSGSGLAMPAGRQDMPGEKFKIVGIVSTGGSEEHQIFTDIHHVQQIVDHPGRVGKVEVSALLYPEDELARKDPETMSKDEYEKWYCRPYLSNITNEIEDVIPYSKAVPIRQIAQTEGVILSKIEYLILFVTLVALFTGALGVMATMTASVLERRKEIGFLKALGAGNWEISLLFLGEAGIIGILGGVIGFGLGILFSIWIGELVFNSTITPRIVVLVVVLLLSVGISFIASLLPLRKAAGILPASVLKGS